MITQLQLINITIIIITTIIIRKQYTSETNFKALRNFHPLGRKLRTPKYK